MQTQNFASTPMQMAHMSGCWWNSVCELPAFASMLTCVLSHRHSNDTFMCEADLVVEGVNQELQARGVERGEGKGTHCLHVGIHMQRCEAEKADPDQPWHLCTQPSQARLQVQGSPWVYMLSCTWACCMCLHIHAWLSLTHAYLACKGSLSANENP